MPIVFDASGIHPIGFSNLYPGGYAEYMALNELLAIKVPTGLPHEMAALTEPLAVGVHAVAKSGIAQGDAAIVIGLGPVGLACIAAMKMLGIGPIVGADFSPARRALAEQLGCDEVVDPNEETAIRAWRRVDGTKPLVVFEAVGVPGMIEHTMRMAPKNSRILIVGACMQEDAIHPMLGIGKELSLQFVLGLAIAFALYKLTFGVKGLNVLLFLPHVVTPVVAVPGAGPSGSASTQRGPQRSRLGRGLGDLHKVSVF